LLTQVEIDETTGESIGLCELGDNPGFALSAILLGIVATSMTAVVAWKTRDVDGTYTESWWIFLLFLVQLEIIIVSAPIVVILKDVSTDGRYIGGVVLLWCFPMSTLMVIMVPKFIAWRRAKKGLDVSDRVRRGQQPGLRVSGVAHAVNGSLAARGSIARPTLPALGSVNEQTTSTGTGKESSTSDPPG